MNGTDTPATPLLSQKSSKNKDVVEDSSCCDPNKIFDSIILIAIILSSMILPLDNPLNDPYSDEAKLLEDVNHVFTAFFLCELTIKMIAKGVLLNKLNHVEPYLRSSWNQIDCFVVSISVTDILMTWYLGGTKGNLSAFKALRALRALRPLRVIRSFP